MMANDRLWRERNQVRELTFLWRSLQLTHGAWRDPAPSPEQRRDRRRNPSQPHARQNSCRNKGEKDYEGNHDPPVFPPQRRHPEGENDLARKDGDEAKENLRIGWESQ